MFLRRFFLSWIVAMSLVPCVRADVTNCYTITSQSTCSGECKWYSDSDKGYCLPNCSGANCVGYAGSTQCVQDVDNLTSQTYSCVACGTETSYATENHLSCVSCSEVTQYKDGNICKTCADNKMANTEHTACDAGCAPGYECVGSGCATCKQCNAGYRCVGGTEAAQKCPRGSFAGQGQANCTACPVKYTTQSTGATSVDACILAPVKLSVGENDQISLPDCLKVGKTNNSVIRVVSD